MARLSIRTLAALETATLEKMGQELARSRSGNIHTAEDYEATAREDLRRARMLRKEAARYDSLLVPISRILKARLGL